MPDYPASDQSRSRQLIFPVFYYHGKIFRSDRDDGARARLHEDPVFAVDVSGSGTFPTKSSENRAREGMDDLDWMGEFGPRFYARIINRRGQLLRVYLVTRAAFTTDFQKYEGAGFVIGPGVSFEHKRFLVDELSFFTKLTLEYGSKEYQDYFYTVKPKDARPGREAYEAGPGYLGTWWTNGVTYEWSDYFISGGFGLVSHAGAANRASPLFRSELNYTLFLGLAWFFYESKTPGYN